ncbi:MAG: TonB-dependent siderophore receptor [Parvibaculum sp.]
MSNLPAKPVANRVLKAFLLASVSLAALGALPALAQETGAAGSDEEAVELAPINVEGDTDALPAPYAGGQVATGARIGVLGNQDIMDVPFSVTSYTEELIRNQQAETIADILVNDPSVRASYGFSTFGETFVIRGFPLSGDDIAFDGLYGISPRQVVGLDMYERVELLKGASAFLNGVPPGGSGTGGTVNLVPKRAADKPLRRVTASYGMNSMFGGAADVGQRFGPNNSWGIRINVAASDGERAIENEERQYLLGAFALDYRGERLRLSLDAASQRQRVDQGRSIVRLTGVTAVPDAPDADHNYAPEWAYYDMNDTFAVLQGEYDLTDNVTAYAGFGIRDMREDSDGATPNVTNVDGTATIGRFTVPREDTAYSGRLGLRTEFVTGGVDHNLDIGGTWIKQDNHNAFQFTAGTPTNIYNPVAIPRPAGGFTSGSFADLPLATRTQMKSVFISDTANFFADRVHLTLGLRHQQIHIENFDRNTLLETSDYDKSETSPVVGLAVNVTEEISLYANRIEGLAQVDPAPAGTVNAGDTFAPYVAVQYEAGGKVDLGSVGFGVSVFETEKPSAYTNAANVYVLDGEQRNRGIEFTTFGEPAKGVRLLGGVTFLEAEQTATLNGTNDGNDAIGVPDYQVNLTGEWDLPFVPGVTSIVRVLHTATQYVDAANSLEVPDWTRLDIGGRYTTDFSEHPVTFNLFIENVTNESYWASANGGYLTMGDPLTAKFSVSTEF